MMTAQTAARCLELLKNTPSITTLDITGGAPELNQHFRYLVSTARALRGKDLIIIDRCNLTVLQEPGQEDLVQFLKEYDVHVVASLPCYSAENVDTQRGGGVFERSIAALLALNEVGYGRNREAGVDGNDNDNDNGDTILVVFRSAKSESSSVLVDSLLFLYLNLYLCLYFASRNVTLRYRVVLGVVGRDVYF
mmetsp:Transcript_14011/g.29580  ORF Transcript_14011/g.29580 Transcript_14011/m.29580 type:complete len:193 (-) Transcript_14011:181-759(-)